MLQKIKVKKCKIADWSQSLPFSYSPFFEPPWRELVSRKKYVLILAPSLWERYGRRKKIESKTKLPFVFGNLHQMQQISTFSYIMISELWGAVSDFEEE